MFGSSAKERLAAFQNKAETKEVKKTVQGPRKIGKLNIPGQKPAEPEKPAPKKKVVKKVTKEKSNNAKEEKETTKPEKKANGEAVKDSASSALNDVDLDLSAELEANIDVSKEGKEPSKPSTEGAKPDKVKEEAAAVKPSVDKNKQDKTVTPSQEKKEETKINSAAKDSSESDKKEVVSSTKEKTQPEVKPISIKDVKGTTQTVAGITPDANKPKAPETTPNTSKPETTETKPAAGKVPEVKPSQLKETTGQTKTVAGIPPPGSEPAKQVSSGDTSSAKAMPVSEKSAETGQNKDKIDGNVKPMEKVEEKTMPDAGVAPKSDEAKKTEEAKPVALKAPEAKVMTVAGISPDAKKTDEQNPKPKSKEEPQTQETQPKSLQNVEAVTKTVAGITPTAGEKTTQKQADAPSSKPDVKAPPPESLKDVQAITTTVAGIAPKGNEPTATQKQPATQKPAEKADAQPAVQAKVKAVIEKPAEQAEVKLVAHKVQEKPAPKQVDKLEAKQPEKPAAKPTEQQSPKKPDAIEQKKEEKQPEPQPVDQKPAEVRKRPESHKQAYPKKKEFEPIPDEFYDNLFYFSGMGTVVGSALSKGVYVPKRNTSTALDIEVIESYEAQRDKEIAQGVRVVKKARNEAEDLAEELRKLQALLSGLPTFGADAGQSRSAGSRPMVQPLQAPQRRSEMPGLDLISQKVEAVAKDIPAPPRTRPMAARAPQPPPAPSQPITRVPQAPLPPPQPIKRMPPPPPQPIRSAFAPVVQAPPPPPRPQAPPIEHRVPPISSLPGPASNVGVFKGMQKNGPGMHSSQSWQERYAGKHVVDAQPPKPFHTGSGGGGGEIPSGLKPWELSRLRGLEAKGYEFSHEAPATGADHSDAFYHGGSHMDGGKDQPITDEIDSLAPFLVSTKSQKSDRAHFLYHDALGADGVPVHMGVASPGAPLMVESPVPTLPYCDL